MWKLDRLGRSVKLHRSGHAVHFPVYRSSSPTWTPTGGRQCGSTTSVKQRSYASRKAGGGDDEAGLAPVPVQRGRLWLSAIAYNLGNLWPRPVMPKKIDNWSLTSLQQRLVKTGGRLVTHAGYPWRLPARRHLRRRLFGSMGRRIETPPVPAG